jgi:hypothetical protein
MHQLYTCPQATQSTTEGIASHDVFDFVSESSVPSGSKFMGSKFHLIVKNSETARPYLFYKAHLVISDTWTPRSDGCCQKHPKSVR